MKGPKRIFILYNIEFKNSVAVLNFFSAESRAEKEGWVDRLVGVETSRHLLILTFKESRIGSLTSYPTIQKPLSGPSLI